MKKNTEIINNGKSFVWPYFLAASIFIFGIVYMVYLILGILEDFSSSHSKFIAPIQNQEVSLEPGSYTVYYEYKTYFEDIYYDTGSSLDRLTVTIVDAQNNKEIMTINNASNSSYTNSDGSGISILDFDIIQSGVYLISASFVNSEHKKVVLSIGTKMGWNFFNSILGIFAILISSMFLSILTAIFGASWNKNRKKKII